MVQGFGFGVESIVASEFRMWGAELSVLVSGFRVQGLGLRVHSFRVHRGFQRSASPPHKSQNYQGLPCLDVQSGLLACSCIPQSNPK